MDSDDGGVPEVVEGVDPVEFFIHVPDSMFDKEIICPKPVRKPPPPPTVKPFASLIATDSVVNYLNAALSMPKSI